MAPLPQQHRDQLSRTVGHALRHEPWLYGLEPDAAGWVPVADLLDSLRATGPVWRALERVDLEEMIAASPKQRYELHGDRIRARYGHSVPGRLLVEPARPPSRLYHGTSPEAWEVIEVEGLRPMGRQYVHLSVDPAMALRVGRRKAPRPVVLLVEADRATADGLPFYRGNDQVWLADAVPPGYLSLS